MSSLKKPLALVGAGVAVLVGTWLIIPHDQPLKDVPYYDPIEAGLKKDIKPGEHHKVFDFSLVNQAGDTVTRKDFAGKLTVVDFFFTTCQGICPRMNTQMQRVYEAFKGNDSVLFLSHTVNPENDSVAVMAEHAKKYGADVHQWHFVTGDRAQIYKLARKSYLVSDTEGDGSTEDFVHSEKFTLVDGDGYIRGLYDGTDEGDVDMLIRDIRSLLR
ncbi:MAG TPA: SCO family protein [Bacteroidia bacterium]|nr:SCO family protein [Bacteroidia bacterium]